MPIAFNPDDRPCNDEDVGGGPYFGYCNVPKLTSNLPFPDFWTPEALNCGSGCEPFTDSDQRQEQAIFLGRPTGRSNSTEPKPWRANTKPAKHMLSTNIFKCSHTLFNHEGAFLPRLCDVFFLFLSFALFFSFFLESSCMLHAGWHKGGRRAVIEAGRKHPDYLYSGLTEYPDPGIVSPEDEQTFGTVGQQSTSTQVREHKYIVNVDGWCSSKRMKQLLASDSAILNVVGMEDQWFTPLLKPMKHYIPVRFEANDPDLEEGSELISKIRWAQEHPQEVGRIVQHAKSFHGFYLSQRGEECYAVQLLEEYSSLLLDSWKLQDRAGSPGSASS